MIVGLALRLAPTSYAVLFDATPDASYNTNAPAGALTNSGWHYIGRFGTAQATAIAPFFVLTAKHLSVSTNFVLDGSNYTLSTVYDDSHSDLRLCRSVTRLPRHAPLYVGTNEVGAPLLAFGRGRKRGNAVVTAGLTNGWKWGGADGIMRWGSNQVASIRQAGGADCLYATFDHGAGPDECHLATWDSGGAAFACIDERWQLAGVHYSVDGSFNQSTNNTTEFNAAIYDGYGLYMGSDNNWTLITNPVPSGFYSTRVSSRYAWITNIIPHFDSDVDGLPDWWEGRYGGSVQGMDATHDADGDGANNLAEWIAGSDPTNTASLFQIAAVWQTNDVDTLSFDGHTDRLYRVWQRDLTLAPTTPWQSAVTGAFSGAGNPTYWSATNTSPATPRFYRLGVTVPDGM